MDRVCTIPTGEVHIGIVGKYVEYEDSYKSLKEALMHGGIAHNLKVNADLDRSRRAGTDEQLRRAQLEGFDGILVPGGFGKRGIDGMLHAIRTRASTRCPTSASAWACRRAVIEFARNVCGLEGADIHEFDPATPHRVIYKLRELRGVDELGGTMRLGAWTCKLKPGSFAARGLRHAARSRSATATATSSTASMKKR